MNEYMKDVYEIFLNPGTQIKAIDRDVSEDEIIYHIYHIYKYKLMHTKLRIYPQYRHILLQLHTSTHLSAK